MNRQRVVRGRIALVCVATATLTTASIAQETPGLTFDVSITTGDSSALPGTQRGRGWLAGNRSRVDLRGPASEVLTVPGMSGSNMSFIVQDSAGTQTVVMLDHDSKKFAYPLKMVEQISQMMASLPDKPRFSAKVANLVVDSLGAGDTVSGFATKRFRLSADVTLSIEMMGESTGETMHVVSEGDYAEELSDYVDPLQNSRTLDALAGGMPLADSVSSAELRKLALARPRGLPLRQTDRVTGVTESGSSPPVVVTFISNIKREPVPSSTFAIPAGYTEAEMPSFPLSN